MLTKTAPDHLHHNIVVSLLTGAGTEELRALRWDHAHLDGDPDAPPPVPPYMKVSGIRPRRWLHEHAEVAEDVCASR